MKADRTSDPRKMVLEALLSKSSMKQDVYHATIALFNEITEVLGGIVEDLQKEVAGVDERLVVAFKERNSTTCELQVAGDVVIFSMHTNVFRLDQSDRLWRSGYLEQDELRGYFGIVNVYNFLSDSMKYDRERDLGYLVARLFLNKDGHFFMQGKRQLGFLYNDLPGSVMDRGKLKEILYTVINYVLEFDLLAPPYDHVNQVTVRDVKELFMDRHMSTGKRLGFRFQADADEPS